MIADAATVAGIIGAAVALIGAVAATIAAVAGRRGVALARPYAYAAETGVSHRRDEDFLTYRMHNSGVGTATKIRVRALNGAGKVLGERTLAEPLHGGVSSDSQRYEFGMDPGQPQPFRFVTRYRDAVGHEWEVTSEGGNPSEPKRVREADW